MKTYSIEYWLAEFGHETSYSGTDDRVRTEGFQTLAEALAFEECQIEQLILDYSNMGPRGATILAEGLTLCSSKLRRLSIRFNSVGDDGAEALATAMTHYNCKLQQVDFGGNGIGDLGAKSLAEAMTQNNCQLQQLELRGNSVGREGVEHLAEAVTHENCKLNQLDLGFNAAGNAGAKALAKALTHFNCNLKNLDLQGNAISTSGAEALAEAVRCDSCKLQLLNFDDNEEAAQATDLLTSALRNKQNMQHIHAAHSAAACSHGSSHVTAPALTDALCPTAAATIPASKSAPSVVADPIPTSTSCSAVSSRSPSSAASVGVYTIPKTIPSTGGAARLDSNRGQERDSVEKYFVDISNAEAELCATETRLAQAHARFKAAEEDLLKAKLEEVEARANYLKPHCDSFTNGFVSVLLLLAGVPRHFPKIKKTMI
ncbi:hypothetical protein CYMTET_14597 [Cymbomonas tetramitiformis]|uniref:Uncharacterized protein n=1 Tax=Cymbomonas tetramitiformis TaxID=36881 RepID=A0AAE0GFP6_9CHLO|nr:hypothetical protein CYMTET_14597 [Cymbomonas tetramitiformis]